MRKDEPRPMNAAETTPSERPPAGSEDPVASLFSGDRTLPAPVVAPEVNESELTRWKSARDSLFGELVKDPAPAAAAPPSRTGRTLDGSADDYEPLTEARPAAPKAPAPAGKPREEARISDNGTPLVRALTVAKIGQQHEPARTSTPRTDDLVDLAPPGLPRLDAPNKKRTQQHAAPPPPAAAGSRPEQPMVPPSGAKRLEPTGKKARPDGTGPTGGPRMRKKTPPTRPESAAVAAATEATARKRLRRGPKPLLLAALALLVLAAGGVSAVVLEIMPDPWAEPAPEMVRRARQPAAKTSAASAPVAAVAAAAPAASAPVAAAPAPASPGAAKKAAAPIAATAAPKPAVPAPVAAAPKPVAAPVLAASAPQIDEGTASADTDQLVQLARKALSEENPTGAEAFARRALARSADDHHSMEVLARALVDQDRGAEAVSFARRIVEKRKKRVPYRLLLGDALLMIGDAAGARKEWQAAAEIEPDNREVRQRLQ